MYFHSFHYFIWISTLICFHYILFIIVISFKQPWNLVSYCQGYELKVIADEAVQFNIWNPLFKQYWLHNDKLFETIKKVDNIITGSACIWKFLTKFYFCLNKTSIYYFNVVTIIKNYLFYSFSYLAFNFLLYNFQFCCDTKWNVEYLWEYL